MTCTTATAPTGAQLRAAAPVARSKLPAARSWQLSPAAAFYLLASITISFLAGSSAPTPLYPLYQAQWGFSPITVTVIFGIYAVALLASLLVVGRLSDHVGRRPVLMTAALVQALTMVLFATAGSVTGLVIARVLQGLATGAAIAAVGAGMLDLNKDRGAVANSVAPALGTALGGIVAGLMVRYLPAPTHLVYLFLGVVFLLQGLGVAFMAEPSAPRPGALQSLKPQFNVPAATRKPLLVAIPALVAGWALAGFYASLGPALVHRTFGLDSSLSGGVALFVLAGSAGAAVLLLHRQPPTRLMAIGATTLLAGVAFALGALQLHSAAAFFIGTAVAGSGFGMAFQGAVRSVVSLAQPHERAGVLSVIFVVSYLAMGTPAVAAGFLLVRSGNILATALQFGFVVMTLAALALWGALPRQDKTNRYTLLE